MHVMMIVSSAAHARRLAAAAAVLLLAFGSVVAPPSAHAGGQALAAPQAPRKGYQLLRAFPDRFTFEYPSRDWDAIAGGTSSLLALTQKRREAAVVVEYQPLRLELAPSEIDEHFAKLEAEPIAARQPGVGRVDVRLIDVGAAKVVVVEFDRTGIAGAEHVRQYSFPLGKHLYRLVCSSPSASFRKYDPVFTVMAESFRLAAAAAPAQD